MDSTSSPNNGKEKKKKERKEKNEKLEAKKRVMEVGPENALGDAEADETNKKDKQDRKSKKVKGKDPERHVSKNVQAQMEKDESDMQKKQGREMVDPSSSPVEDRKERKKKRKREEQEARTEVKEEDSKQIEGEPEPKKKKSRNKTGFPDPQEEALLSDQARKALGYAFSQFRKPSKWKFHKARQNWIIRNVWSSESVPDSQIPLILKYLSNVQGNTRENLIKNCESIIAETAIPSILPTPAAEQDVAEQTVRNDTQQPANSIKALRAQALLSVLKGDVQV